MIEPLQYFYNKNNIIANDIKKLIIGEKYLAILLKNGNIGVCSTLNNKIDFRIEDFSKIDLNNINHRIAACAYFNAINNYNNKYNCEIDIFDEIDFKKYNNIIMIGFFRSLVNKFEKENINLTIFDKVEVHPMLTCMNEQIENVKKADAVILSGTTIFNKTFLNIVNNTNNNCDVFLLGPSNILNKDMFNYNNIKFVFGSVFANNDNNVLNIIKDNGGTKDFLPYMKKVYIQNDI